MQTVFDGQSLITAEIIAGSLGRGVAVEIIPPQPQIERQLVADSPLVLRIETEVELRSRFCEIWACVLRDKTGNAVDEPVVHEPVGDSRSA